MHCIMLALRRDLGTMLCNDIWLDNMFFFHIPCTEHLCHNKFAAAEYAVHVPLMAKTMGTVT